MKRTAGSPVYHVYILSFRDDADDDPYVWLTSSWVELIDEQVIRRWALDADHDWAGDTPEERYAPVVRRRPTIVATDSLLLTPALTRPLSQETTADATL